MEGEGEVKGDTGMEIGSQKNRKASAHFTHHTRAELIGCSAQQKWIRVSVSWPKQPPFLSSFCSYHLPDGPTLLLLPPGYEKAVQTQPVSPGPPPGSGIRPLLPCFFFPFFSSLWLFFIYLQLDACSSIDYFTKDLSGLCLGRAGLQTETFSHTHPASQLLVCRRKRWGICDGKAKITILNLPSRFDDLCVSFGGDWWSFWEVGAAFEHCAGGFLHPLPTTLR